MKWNNAVTTAISAANSTTTSSAIDCEGWDGLLLTIDENSATIAGTVEVLANHQSLNATTYANTNPLTNWLPFNAPFTCVAGGSSHIVEPVPPSIKVKFTRSGGTATVRVQGFKRG